MAEEWLVMVGDHVVDSRGTMHKVVLLLDPHPERIAIEFCLRNKKKKKANEQKCLCFVTLQLSFLMQHDEVRNN